MNNESRSLPAFREEQRFQQVWIWFLVLGIAALIWYSAIQQIILRRPFGSRPAPDTLLIIFWLLFGIGMPVFFLSARLVTEVRSDGIYVRFFPIHFSYHKISLGELKSFEVRKYNALREYGGWGIRYGPQGKAYNVGGNRGVQLVLTDGKRILIGSQRPEEFLSALQSEHAHHQTSVNK
jgi:hypothetical protein